MGEAQKNTFSEAASIFGLRHHLRNREGRAALNSLRREWSPEVGRGESKHPSLPLARAERKPLDQKKKHPPRYQRENLLKKRPY